MLRRSALAEQARLLRIARARPPVRLNEGAPDSGCAATPPLGSGDPIDEPDSAHAELSLAPQSLRDLVELVRLDGIVLEQVFDLGERGREPLALGPVARLRRAGSPAPAS